MYLCIHTERAYMPGQTNRHKEWESESLRERERELEKLLQLLNCSQA